MSKAALFRIFIGSLLGGLLAAMGFDFTHWQFYAVLAICFAAWAVGTYEGAKK